MYLRLSRRCLRIVRMSILYRLANSSSSHNGRSYLIARVSTRFSVTLTCWPLRKCRMKSPSIFDSSFPFKCSLGDPTLPLPFFCSTLTRYCSNQFASFLLSNLGFTNLRGGMPASRRLCSLYMRLTSYRLSSVFLLRLLLRMCILVHVIQYD